MREEQVGGLRTRIAGGTDGKGGGRGPLVLLLHGFGAPGDDLVPLADAVNTMADMDLGSLVVMDHGELVGMLTFREVIQRLVQNGGAIGDSSVRSPSQMKN